MAEHGYRCENHQPPLTSGPIDLTLDDLKIAHKERHELAWVLERFGNVDNDAGLTAAAAWLRDHRDCQQHIWTSGTVQRHHLECPPQAVPHEVAQLRHDVERKDDVIEELRRQIKALERYVPKRGATASGPEPAPGAPGTAGVGVDSPRNAPDSYAGRAPAAQKGRPGVDGPGEISEASESHTEPQSERKVNE